MVSCRARAWLFGLLMFGFVHQNIQASPDCPASFFDCKNSRCIASFFVCDDDNDCGNFEDEMNCFENDNSSMTTGSNSSSISFSPTLLAPQKCPDDHFSCNDTHSTCLPIKWKCDGIKECANGADEENCDKNSQDCGDDFRCNDGECIPHSWSCDGISDCLDNSDELNCTKIESVAVNCDREHGQYQCITGQCIDFSLVCDKKNDCPLADDEGTQCHLQTCADKKCSDLCVVDVASNSTRCLCRAGYQLKNGTTCVDFDECSDNKLTNMCSQECVNLVGSHRCECAHGYTLVNSSRCVISEGPSVLFYSFDDQIRTFELKENRLSEAFVGQPSETITELDIDVKRRKLFYIATKVDSHGTVYEAQFDNNFKLGTRKTVLVHDKLSGLEGISVDYVTGNLYMTDSVRNTILVCRDEPAVCVTLIKARTSPRAIVALPSMNKLFWTEWGASSSGIYQSNLDGSNVTLFIDQLTWPNGLTYDEIRNRLYWTDGKFGKVEYYDFDLELRHHVFEDHHRQPYSVQVFEDNLYWNDWSMNELVVQDKITGHHLRPIIFNSAKQFLGLAVYHASLQRPIHNPCLLNMCSHLCLFKSSTEFTCACPDHMRLNGQFECVPNDNETYILVTSGRKIFKFYKNEITNLHSEEINIPSHIVIGDLTYSWEQQQLYIFDVESDSIGKLGFQHSRPRYEKLVNKDIKMVQSLTYEHHSNALYWVDVALERIDVLSLTGNHRRTLFNSNQIQRPLSLALDSQNRVLYIGSRTTPSKIFTSRLDGQGLRTVMETRSGAIPVAMVKTESRRLVFADPTLSKIEEVTTVGMSLVGHPRKLNSRPVGNVHSLGVDGNTVLWTNADSPKLFYAEFLGKFTLFNNTLPSTIFFKNLPSSQDIDTEYLRLAVVSKPKRSTLHCSAGHNKCAHICLLGAKTPTCLCAEGYSTIDNGLTCQKDTAVSSIHDSPLNATEAFKLFANIMDDIFRQNLNITPHSEHDYEDDAWEMFEETQFIPVTASTTQAPVITASTTPAPLASKLSNNPKIEALRKNLEKNIPGTMEPIRPSVGPLTVVFIVCCLLVVIGAFVCYQFPTLRERFNIPIMSRNTSQTRYFRNPNYSIGVEDGISFQPGSTQNKASDANGNNLL